MSRSTIRKSSIASLVFLGVIGLSALVRAQGGGSGFQSTFGELAYEEPSDESIVSPEIDPSELDYLQGEGWDWPDVPDLSVEENEPGSPF